MAFGDPQGNFGASGGYGGNFGGAGGSSLGSSPGGPAYGGLGYGGMSPGGYSPSTYGANALGQGGVPGFGARVMAARALAQKLAFQGKYPNFQGNKIAQQPQKKSPSQVTPIVNTPPTQVVPEEPIPNFWEGYDPLSSINKPGINGWPSAWGGYGQLPANQWGAYNNFPKGGMPGGGWQGLNSGYGNQTPDTPDYHGPGGLGGLQLGGPALPGQTYTVGENGPETLHMAPGGGGQVVPHNPGDRMRGAMQQLRQWHAGRQNANGRAGFGGRPGPMISPGPAPFQVGSPNLALRGFA